MSSLFKGLGYLVSALSVVLLGIVAWQGAAQNRLLMLCLVGGMATSVLGMALRWVSHRIDQKEKRRLAAARPGATAQDSSKSIESLRNIKVET